MNEEMKELPPRKGGSTCSNSKGKIGEAEAGEGEDEEEEGISGSRGGESQVVGEDRGGDGDVRQEGAAEGRKRKGGKRRGRKGRIHSDNPDESSDSDDGDNDSTEKTAKYLEKYNAVLKYKPFLEVMIKRLEKAGEKTREAQLIKMQSLHDILFNPAKQLKLGTIRSCEKVLRGLYEKIEKRTNLPLRTAETGKEESEDNAVISKTSSSMSITKEVVVTTSITTKEIITLSDTPYITKHGRVTTLTSGSSLNKKHKVTNVADFKNLEKVEDDSSISQGVAEETCRKPYNSMKEFDLLVHFVPTTNILNMSTIQTSSRNVESLENLNNVKNTIYSSTEQTHYPLKINDQSKSLGFTNNNANSIQKSKTHRDKRRWDIPALEDKNLTATNQVEKENFSEKCMDIDVGNIKTYAPVEQENSGLIKNSMRRDIEINPIAKGNTPECASSKSEPLSDTTSFIAPIFSTTSSFPGSTFSTTSSFLSSQFSTTSSFLTSTFSTTSSFLTSTHSSSLLSKFNKESFDTGIKKKNYSESMKDTSSENKHQSLREKLTEEISTVHKVGTSSGGALRGLLNRDDKTITTSRMANLKAGTIMDLIGKGKPYNLPKTSPKKPFKKPDEEAIKLHDIPLPKPMDQTPTNDTNNTGFLDLGLNSTNTLEEIAKMDPKDLERIVNDHILKLPNSSELVRNILPKEDSVQNFSSENSTSFSDLRSDFNTACGSSNIPEYDFALLVNQNLQSNPSVSQFSPHAFNMQSPITNSFSQPNQNFIYNDLTQGNHSLYYSGAIEPDGFNNPGVYTRPECNNVFNRNQSPSSFSNYNNLAEHWKLDQSQQNTYSRNLEQNQQNVYSRNLPTSFQQNTFNQSNTFKWNRRNSSFENSSGYNMSNRSSFNRAYNNDRNLNSSKDCRNTGFENPSRSLTPSQQVISTRDPRRRSIEGTVDRTNTARTEQPRNQRNDPRLYRNYNKNNNDIVSNRDPRIRASSSSSPSSHHYKSQEKKVTKIESDYKTKLTASSEKLHKTSEDKSIKGYSPHNFKIPKLKNNNLQISDNKTNALSDKNSKPVGRNSVEEIDETKDKTASKERKEKGESRSSKLKKDLPLDNKNHEVTDDYENDDEIKPVRNPRKRRHHWDELEESDSCDTEMGGKETMAKRGKNKESHDKLKGKDKKDFDKKRKKKSNETKTTAEIEDKTTNKVNEEDEQKVKKIEEDKNSMKSVEEESSSVKDSTRKSPSTTNKCEDKTNITSESVVFDESSSLDKLSADKTSANEIQNSNELISFQNISSQSSETLHKLLPKSLIGLIELEEKTRFFSKLGENLNLEKLKKIKKIIESNSDDEDVPVTEDKPSTPSVANAENKDSENKTILSCNQDLGDNSKQTAKSVSGQIIVSKEATNNEDETCTKNHNLINKKEDITENSSSLSNKMQEINQSIEDRLCFDEVSNCETGMEDSDIKTDITENLMVEEKTLGEKDFEYLNKKMTPKKSYSKRKTTKRGFKKKTNSSKSLISSAIVDDQSLNDSTAKPKKKQKNELEKLQEDIRDMFISEDVVSATGLRQCRLRKLSDGVKNEDSREQGGSSTRVCREGKKGIKEKRTDLFQSSSSSSSSSDEETKIHDNSRKKVTRRSSTKTYKEDSDVRSTSDVKSSTSDVRSTTSDVTSTSDVKSITSSLNQEKSNLNNKETDLNVEEAVGSPVVVLEEIGIGKVENPLSEQVSESLLRAKENVSTEQDPITKTGLSYPVESSLLSVQRGRKKMVTGIKKKALAFSIKNKKFKNIKKQCKVFNKKELEKIEINIITEPKLAQNMNDDIYYYQREENETHKCKICPYQGKVIVRHYVLNHYDEEVLISRLSPDSAKQAIEEAKKMNFNEFHLVSLNSQFKGVFYCRMCSRSFNKIVNFFDHMGYHTGEYRYHCKVCTYKTSSKSGLVHHMMTGHGSYKKGVVTAAYEDPPCTDLLLGYLCSYCNYIQLFLSNLEKHITTNHAHITEQSIKAITINLSKPVEINDENDINVEQDNKDNIQLFNENLILATNETDELVSEIKVEEPNDITIMDVTGVATDLNDSFQEDTQLENIEPVTKAEDSSNGQKPIDLEVFVGFENINPKDKDSELNIEREQIMNKIVSKLKTQTKPLKDSVLEQIKSKLTFTEVESNDNLQKNYKKDLKCIESSLSLDSKQTSSLESTSTEVSECTRRILPVRSCKEKSQMNVNTIEKLFDSDSSDYDSEMQKFVDELAKSGSDNSEVDDDLTSRLVNAIERTTITKSAVKNKPIVSTITRLQDNLNRSDTNLSENNTNLTGNTANQQTVIKKSVSREILIEISSKNFNNHVSNINCPISSLVCKDMLPLKVGPLEINNLNDDTTYRCNYNCTYTTTVTAEFRKHVEDHPTGSCGWNGKCVECRAIYVKGGKRTFFSLITAFCHLVNDHLLKQKTNDELLISTLPGRECIPPPPPAIPLENVFRKENHVTELPKLKIPLLRVRRLSGDKLSVPAAENSLTVGNNQQKPNTVDNQESDVSDLICYEDIDSNRETSQEFTTPEDEGCSFLRIESVVSLNPETAIEFRQDSVEERESSESLDNSKASGSLIPINLIPQPTSQAITIIPIHPTPVVHFTSPSIPSKTLESLPSQPDTSTPINTNSSNSSRGRRFNKQTSPLSKTSRDPIPKPSLVQGRIGKKNKRRNTRKSSANVLVKSVDIRKNAKDFKMYETYEKMLVPRKLRHFYKCMGVSCDFSCIAVQRFTVHYTEHVAASVEEDPVSAWNLCCYCFYSSDCVTDYCLHMKKEHGESFMQCAYCFYRSSAVENVLYHQTTSHITQTLKVLQCLDLHLPPTPRDVVLKDYIKPYRCIEGRCRVRGLNIWTPNALRAHAQINHMGLEFFRCFLCRYVENMEGLIEHYEIHGLGMYQCLYCVHGTASEDQMRDHLCYSHANVYPSGIIRAEIDAIPGHVQPGHNVDIEKFKRMNFKELEEKNHVIVPFEPLKDDDIVSYPRTLSTLASNALDTNTVCQSDDNNVINENSDTDKKDVVVEDEDEDVQIIKTVTKKDKITVITIDTSDEEVECEEIPESLKTYENKKSSLSSQGEIIKTYSRKNKLPSTSSQEEEPLKKKSKENPTEQDAMDIPILPKNEDIICTNEPDGTDEQSDVGESSKSVNKNKTTGLTGKALFRCGYKGCDFGAQDSATLKEHLGVCGNAHLGSLYDCVHCSKSYKHPSSYIEHIRCHGASRYFCSLCEFKTPIVHRVTTHMKQVHRITNTKVEPMNPREIDHDRHQFVCIPKVNNKGVKSNAKKNPATPTKFSLSEIDKIPFRSIFPSPMGCSSCVYETKVRSNLVQHLMLHAAGHSVPQEELVNPVPCLENKEKMFDKMMNLAGSSHANSAITNTDKILHEEGKPEVFMPGFVPSNRRYMCHAEGCAYAAITDTMLKYHIRTLHVEETHYRCPHCPVSSNPVIMEKLPSHLKMHDVKLYACSTCDYYHFSRHIVEKHVDKHEFKAVVKVIRENSVQQNNPIEEESGTDAVEVDSCIEQSKDFPNQNTSEKKNWHCNMCKFRSDDETSIRNHSQKAHGMATQFKCRLCKLESDLFSDFIGHFSNVHPNLPTQIITSFSKVIDLPPATSDNTNQPEMKSYWRRNSNTVKHIRGILIEEESMEVLSNSSSMSPVNSPELRTEDELSPTKSTPLEEKFGPFGEPGPENEYRCPKCNNLYKYKSELQDHLYKELDYTPWLCTYCGRTARNKSTISKHIKVAHERETGIDLITLHRPNQEIEIWVNNVFSVQQGLMKQKLIKKRDSVKNQPNINTHTKSKPTSKKPEEDELQSPGSKKKKLFLNFMCGYCSTATVLKKSVRSHQLKKHPDLPSLILNIDGTPTKNKRCSKSSKVDETQTNISDTVDDNETESEPSDTEYSPEINSTFYTCGYCNWTGSSISVLKKHWVSLHKTPVYLSNGTKKQGTGTTFLCNQSQYSPDSEYVCSICQKQGSISVLKDHHSKDHVGLKFQVFKINETEYKCFKCGLSMKTLGSLRKHNESRCVKIKDGNTEVHDSEILHKSKANEIYRCPKCAYTKRNFDSVVKHLAKHFQKFFCGVCDHTYLSAPGIRHHMNFKHPGSSVKPLIVNVSDSVIEVLKKDIIVHEVDEKKKKALGNLKDSERCSGEVEPSTSVSNETVTNQTTLKTKIRSIKTKNISDIINYAKICAKQTENQKHIENSSLSKLSDAFRNYLKISDEYTENLTLRNMSDAQNGLISFKTHDKTVKLNKILFNSLFSAICPKVKIDTVYIHQNDQIM